MCLQLCLIVVVTLAPVGTAMYRPLMKDDCCMCNHQPATRLPHVYKRPSVAKQAVLKPV